MPRRIIYLLLLLALALTACKSASQTVSATNGPGNVPGATIGPTSAPKQPDTLNVPVQAPSVPGCTVVSFRPTPDPSSIFPPVSADDWHRGPLTATVTIIEYSDFQ
jgi:hypothetical protein